jgi:uncharacterized protein (DUF1501 family)
MSQSATHRLPARCPGPLGRRSFLRAGTAALAAAGLGPWPRLSLAGGASDASPSETACIFVYLHGGPSHLETYDLKPESPEEYRGVYKPIPTAVPGIEICELLPRHAQVADRFTLIRSCSHDSTCHDDGAQQVLSGRRTPFTRQPGSTIPNKFPEAGAVVKRLRAGGTDDLPSYVAVPHRQEFAGPGFFGNKYEPFAVRANPNDPRFEVPNLSLPLDQVARLDDRRGLLRSFDRLRREIDGGHSMEAVDGYRAEALQLLTGDAARRAFDLSQEDPRQRDRYGRCQVGQSFLLARRLVEAGVSFVHVEGRDFSDVGPSATGNWDDHSVNGHMFDKMDFRLPLYDQAVAALVEDLYARGLDRRVLLVVTGEFGRTPRITSINGNPGRDHWPSAMAILVSGGGMRVGQVIGSTTARGEVPKDRPLHPSDLIATVYQFLGIDRTREFLDHSGRPLPVLPDGDPIPELSG